MNNPIVSVVMPVRNEERFIARCLTSIFQATYPINQLEVILVDGASVDKTLDIARDFTKNWPLTIVDNPRRIVSAAMNIGIAKARGQFIIRMDGHCIYDPQYVEKCVELMQNTDADNVGGTQTPAGISLFERTLATVLKSKFAAGSSYWNRSHCKWVNTVFLGAWKKETIERIGLFNESWVVNQDSELNARLIRSGGKILYSPEIKSLYFVRPGIKPLIRQHYRYGMYRVKTINEYPEIVSSRHFAPALLVLSVAFSGILSFWTIWPLVAIASVYFIISLIFAFGAFRDSGLRMMPVGLVLFPIIHFSWGFGFINGVRRWGLSPIALRKSLWKPSGS